MFAKVQFKQLVSPLYCDFFNCSKFFLKCLDLINLLEYYRAWSYNAWISYSMMFDHTISVNNTSFSIESLAYPTEISLFLESYCLIKKLVYLKKMIHMENEVHIFAIKFYLHGAVFVILAHSRIAQYQKQSFRCEVVWSQYRFDMQNEYDHLISTLENQ